MVHSSQVEDLFGFKETSFFLFFFSSKTGVGNRNNRNTAVLIFTIKALRNRKDTTFYFSYSKGAQNLGLLFMWQIHTLNYIGRPLELTCVLYTGNQLLVTCCKSLHFALNSQHHKSIWPLNGAKRRYVLGCAGAGM